MREIREREEAAERVKMEAVREARRHHGALAKMIRQFWQGADKVWAHL